MIVFLGCRGRLGCDGGPRKLQCELREDEEALSILCEVLEESRKSAKRSKGETKNQRSKLFDLLYCSVQINLVYSKKWIPKVRSIAMRFLDVKTGVLE